MLLPPLPENEELRLGAVREYAPLEPFSDTAYASLLETAQDIFEVSAALISFVDRDRQMFAVRRGLELCETGRDVSFCAHAIAHEELLVVLDATLDPRLRRQSLGDRRTVYPVLCRGAAGQPIRARCRHSMPG